MVCRKTYIAGLVGGILLAAVPLFAKVASPPSVAEKCPVCGMFVSKYPDWLAVISYKDGRSAYFDGPKDLFRYLTNMKRYAPGRNSAVITTITVKDYYSLKQIDGKSAYFVVGSDVYGPMGKELIPFASLAAAQDFKKDHQGKKILRFTEITPQSLAAIE